MAIRPLRRRGGDRWQLRLLRRVSERDHVPDGAAGAVERGGGGGGERLVGDGQPDAAAGRLRRRLLPRPLPIHRPSMHPLRPGVWHAHAGVHAAGAAPVADVHRRLLLPPFVAAGGLLLRLPLPHRPRAGRRQALRPGLRRRPARPQPPQGARRPQLPLQLVVLLHGRRHRRRRRSRQLHPGERRLGRRLRRPGRHHALRLRRLPPRHPHLPPLLAQPRRREPLRPPRPQPRRPHQETAPPAVPGFSAAGRRRSGGGQVGGGTRRAAAAAHMGDVPGLRRGVRADHDALQQAGPHPGPPHRRRPGAAAGGASDVRAGDHPGVRAHLRPRAGAGAAVRDGQPDGADDAAARGHGHGAVAGGGVGCGGGGGAAAGDCAGARAGGRARGDGADELGVAGAAVRGDRGGGRVRGDRDAGVLLRPNAQGAAQPGPRALPQRHWHRRLHQQPPHLPHRPHHQRRRRRQLVRRQPQPRPPRLLLLAARRTKRRRARALPLPRNLLRLQPHAPLIPTQRVH